MANPLPFARAWLGCRRCELSTTRHSVVLGVGNPNADIFICGESPGPDEDKVGSPFIGRSGKLLDIRFLNRLQWSREQIFIDNLVGCWPMQEDEAGSTSTRKPTGVEIRACQDRIWETIYRVDPLVIVALGGVALKGLTGVDERMKTAHGGLFMAKVPGFYKSVTYPVFPTYHPAWLLRNPAKRNMVTVWEDLYKVDQYLERLRTIYETARKV